jgi:flagellar assembly protein FliH
MSMALLQTAVAAPRPRAEVELSSEELAERIRQERAEASGLAEQRVRQEYEPELEATRASIAAAIAQFDLQRSDYFARVEAEVVQLALAIAAKILHREAQVDPMLVAALVRISIEQMCEGSSVAVRVNPARATAWKQYFAGQAKVGQVEVVEDPELSTVDCVVETELGTTNFGLDRQLKEVEQGFFDLLALRPESR